MAPIHDLTSLDASPAFIRQNAFIKAHVTTGMIVCPSCRSHLKIEEADTIHFACSSCNGKFPSQNGVPLLVPPSSFGDSLVDKLAKHIGISQTFNSSVEKALATPLKYGFTDGHLQAEFSTVVERFNISGPGPQVFNEDPDELSWKTVRVHGFQPLPARSQVFINVRLENISPVNLYQSVGIHPFYLSYHWYDEKGKLIDFEGLRSEIPVPFKPSSELTIPVKIQTPQHAGIYRLKLLAVKERVRWYEDFPIAEIECKVEKNPTTRLRSKSLKNEGPFNYEQDLHYVSNLISSNIESLAVKLGRKVRILEIAGGMYPQALLNSSSNSEVFSTDICFAESQLANIFYLDKNKVKGDFCFICCDCNSLPFQTNSFDIIIICAALHHFPDPVALLKNLNTFLSEQGRVLLVREPCFVDPKASAYLLDLGRGINEQQFEVEEYESFFDKAGFEVEFSRIDFGGSLKVALKKK